jgi:phage-related protein
MGSSYAENIVFRFIGYNLLGSAVREASGMLRELAGNGQKSTSQLATDLSSAGSIVTAVGAGMMLAGAAIAGGIGFAVSKAAEFNSQMILLHTQARVSTDQLGILGSSVLKMAGDVGFSSLELAKALYFIESVGGGSYTAAHALDILKAAAMGAAVGHADLAITASNLASVMAVFPGMLPTQAMGQLDAIIGQGKMTMEDLNGALRTGILATLQASGVSLADFGGALATMTDYAIPATQAANALRMAIYLIQAPTGASNKVLKEFGLTTAEASSTSQAWTDALARAGIRHSKLADDLRKPGGIILALTDLRNGFIKAGMDGNAQAEAIYKAFGGGKMGKAIITLYENIGGGAKASNDKLKELGFTTDEIATLHDRLIQKTALINAQTNLLGKNFQYLKDNDPAFMWKQFQASVGALVITLGQAFIPVLVAIIRYLTPIIVRFTEWANANQPLIRAIGVIAVVFLLVGGAALVLLGTLAMIAGAILAIGAAGIGATILPVVGILLLIGATIAGAAILIIKHWGAVSGFLKQFTPLWNDIKNSAKGTLSELTGFFQDKLPQIQRIVGNVLAFISKLWKEHGDQVIAVLRFYWSLISTTFQIVTTLLKGIIGVFLDLLEGNWRGAWNKIVMAARVAWTMIWGLIQVFAKLIWTFIGKWVTDIWNTVVAFWKEFASKPGYYIGLALGFIIGGLIKLVLAIGYYLALGVIKLIEWGVITLNELQKALGRWVSTSLAWLGDHWGEIFAWIFESSLTWGPQLFDVGRNLVIGLWNGLSSLQSWITNNIKGFGRGFIDALKIALGISSPSVVMALQIGKPIIQGVWMGIAGEAPALQSKFSSLMVGIPTGVRSAATARTGTTTGTQTSSDDQLRKIADLLTVLVTKDQRGPTTGIEGLVYEITRKVDASRARGLKGYST